MRFFISTNIKENKPLYYTVIFFLFFLLLYWLASWVFFYAKYGFTYSSVFKYFFMDEEVLEAISLSQVSEDLHLSLFLKAFFFLVLFSLFLLSKFSERLKLSLTILSFLLGFLENLSDLFILYLSPIFVYLKLLSFFGFQIFTGIALILTLIFLLSKENEKPPGKSQIKLIIFLFSLFLVAFVLTNFLVFFSKMGISLDSIKDYYLGNPETFSKPKTFEGMFKVIYPHLLSMAVFSIVVAHFVFFTPAKGKVFLSASLFLLSFLDNVLGLFIRFVHPNFALIKLLTFLLLQAILLYVSFLLVFYSRPKGLN